MIWNDDTEKTTGISREEKYGISKITYVEIVRCGQCAHCYFASNRIPKEQAYACEKHGIDVTPDWYCADGERQVKWNERR